MKKLIATAAVVLASATTLQAQNWEALNTRRVESGDSIEWSQVSPGNAGMATMLRYHPTLKNVVAMLPDMWNGYISENNGTSWRNIIDCDGDGGFNRPHDLTFSISDPNYVVAVCSSEVWQSSDLCRTWRLVPNCPWYQVDTDGSDRSGWMSKVGCVAIDPNNKDVWYVGGGSNVRGQDWMSCMHGANSANPHYGREYKTMGQLWKTTNAGKSWTSINSGLPEKIQVARFIINPKNSNQVFAASNYGLFRSEDGGKRWDHISKGKLESDIVMDMDYYYNAESGEFRLYLIDQVQYLPSGKTTKCRGGIFYSDDEGKTWSKINGNISLDYNRITGDAPNNYYRFIARWFGITIPEAKSKYPKLPTNAIQYLSYICVDPSRKDALYIGLEDPQIQLSIVPGRLWATENNGETWVSTARLYTHIWEADKEYWEERNNPWHENMKVGHSSPHMQWGKNYAQRSMRGLSVGVDGSVMILSDHSTSLSTDYGKTWNQVDEDYTPSGAIIGRGNSDMPAHVIGQDRRNNRTLLGSGEHNLWLPAYDDPEGRIAIKFIKTAPETVDCIAFDPYDDKVSYITSSRQGSKQYIFRSEDCGETWAKHGIATPATDKWLDDFYTNGLTIDPINPQYMYLGVTKIENKDRATEGGFFRSEDGGKSFQQSNNGLPEIARISDITFDPRDNTMKSLYAAAQWGSFNRPKPEEGGLYYSSDRGESWSKVSTPEEVKSVQRVLFDQSGRLYITAGYRGAGNGVWYSDDYGKRWKKIFQHGGVEHIDVSPFDRDMIVVTVQYLSKNPGVYFSRNRGKSWSKSNRDIAIPHHVEDIKFDIVEADKLWSATLGCGFYRGIIKDGDKVQVVKVSPTVMRVKNGEKITLEAKIVNTEYQKSKIEWRSENEAIATVNNKGEVSAKGRGCVKIWATAEGGRFTDHCVVTCE